METIARLIKDHSELVGNLQTFSFPHAAQMIAALSLCPELLANSTRIELLQHLAAVSCKGNANPQREHLVKWARKILATSPLARWEDPVEDVFVDYTNSTFGGFRVFPGIVSDAGFWAECLLTFLAEKQNFPPFQFAVQGVLPLLKISEELANRMGFARYSTGGGIPGDKINIPQWTRLSILMSAVHFSTNDLAALEVGKDTLRKFILTPEAILRLPDETLWNSSLERHPLVEVDDGIIIAAPSSLLPAC